MFVTYTASSRVIDKRRLANMSDILSAQSLLSSPEFYPLRIDFQKRVIHFVRMSPEGYRNSVFLDDRTQHLGNSVYQRRIDDLLLADATFSQVPRRVHYILHNTFCCSTLLARYFELLPSCFVLKEPGVLTQLALASDRSAAVWQEAFHLCLRLMTRTYHANECVIVKPHEPVNCLGDLLLSTDQRSSITFLTIALKSFLLSVLKSQERRSWVRRRIHKTLQISSMIPALANTNLQDLSDPEAIAYLWLLNRFLCARLVSGAHGSRVRVVDGALVADSPIEVLRAVSATIGAPLDEQSLRALVAHPTISKYSKDLSRSYDSSSRRLELFELETRWGTEAEAGIKWAASRSAQASALA